MQAIRYLHLFLWMQLASSRHVHFYRRDYTYIREYDAFYKLHLDANATNWNYAFLTCNSEGSKLFYPKEENEMSVVKELIDKLDEARNKTEVFIGVHNQFHIGEFVTVDGEPLPSFMGNKIKPGESGDYCVVLDSTDYKLKSCSGSSPVPFVCKREDKKLCPTIDPGYKYYAKSNKCYKLNKKSANWNEAMKTCYMEGGLLTVIDDDPAAFKDILQNLNTDTDYYVGLRDVFQNGNYYSIKGIKYDGTVENDSPMVRQYNGYELPPIPDDMSLLEYKQMHGLPYDMDISRESTFLNEDKLCGVLAMYKSKMIKIVSCDEKLPFICEMEL